MIFHATRKIISVNVQVSGLLFIDKNCSHGNLNCRIFVNSFFFVVQILWVHINYSQGRSICTAQVSLHLNLLIACRFQTEVWSIRSSLLLCLTIQRLSAYVETRFVLLAPTKTQLWQLIEPHVATRVGPPTVEWCPFPGR